LENYLELEKLSTNNKFEFSIKISEDIEAENTEIPPMMIQPFVENAIIHGVKQKDGQGEIMLNFVLQGKRIICEVIDNGIGRKASSENKSQTRKNHKSTGILVTKKRLEQFQIQTSLELGVEFIDLIEHDQASGTKVVIAMPFEAY